MGVKRANVPGEPEALKKVHRSKKRKEKEDSSADSAKSSFPLLETGVLHTTKSSMKNCWGYKKELNIVNTSSLPKRKSGGGDLRSGKGSDEGNHLTTFRWHSERALKKYIQEGTN